MKSNVLPHVLGRSPELGIVDVIALRDGSVACVWVWPFVWFWLVQRALTTLTPSVVTAYTYVVPLAPMAVVVLRHPS